MTNTRSIKCLFNLLRNHTANNRFKGDFITQLFRFCFQIFQHTFFVFLFIIIGSRIVLGLAGFPKSIKHKGKLMSGRSDCWVRQVWHAYAGNIPRSTCVAVHGVSCARRKVFAARFTTFRVLLDFILPPVIRLSGNNPDHEAK